MEKLQTRDILLKTIHGSHLYGFSNSNSDIDYYYVVRDTTKYKYSKQTIANNIDSMIVDFNTWSEMCKSGVPQALEAMYSTKAEIDNIAELRASFRCGTQVYDRYFRTIKSFALSGDDGIKKRRHALRLGFNLRDIGRHGRFNPTLSDEDIDYVTRMATKSHSDVYGLAQCIAW